MKVQKEGCPQGSREIMLLKEGIKTKELSCELHNSAGRGLMLVADLGWGLQLVCNPLFYVDIGRK